MPHGVSVILAAPPAFRFTASACPERHLAGAAALGAGVQGAAPADAGEVLAGHLLHLMKEAGMPGGLGALGYGPPDVEALAQGAALQARLLNNAPREVGPQALQTLFREALAYW